MARAPAAGGGGLTRAAACALVLLAAAPLARAQDAPAAAPRRLGLEDYRAELRAGEAELARGDWPAAAVRGGALRGSQVAFAGETVAVDPAVVDALAGARPATLGASLVRVRAVLHALPAEDAPAPPAPDPALLRRAQEAERRAALPKGGEVSGDLPVHASLPRRVLDALGAAWDWVWDLVKRFGEWLRGLWPKRAPEKPVSSPLGTTVMVIALVILIAGMMAWLAVAALRRSQRGRAAAALSQPERASERDADPLSREQDEWETYAAELARSGRLREAIRAWYHAVLVALFRAGLLQHRKGRTNWEYVSRLPADTPWRPRLIALTRHFDREWYGRERSSPESLRECAGEARAILAQVRGERAA